MPAERARVPGIKPARADLILAGAIVVQTVMQTGGFAELEVTEEGLREGVFFSHTCSTVTHRCLRTCGAARSSTLPRSTTWSPCSTYMSPTSRCNCSTAWRQSACTLVTPSSASSWWSACVLHDIGMAVDYDDHHKHSRYLVLHSGLLDTASAEVALIGQMVRYHRKGTPVLGAASSLARDGDDVLMRRCALMLRLAEGLERSRDQAVTNVEVKNGNKEHITLKSTRTTRSGGRTLGRTRRPAVRAGLRACAARELAGEWLGFPRPGDVGVRRLQHP